MALNFQSLYASLRARAESYGIRVEEQQLGPETPGKFDGLSITMNPVYALGERCYYLVHALGSIACWSQGPQECQELFDELHAARAQGQAEPRRLERAIQRYRAFEEDASRRAVWLLADLGHGSAVPSYTTFARADIEALAHLHRHGVARVWREFFPQWKREVADGERTIRPYEPSPVPPFRPGPMRTQEVIQERDGKV